MSGELPKGWIETTLGNIVTLRGEKVTPAEYLESPYLGLEDIEPHTARVLRYSRAGDFKSAAARFYSGDILYSRLRPYLNKVSLAECDGLASAELLALKVAHGIDANFVVRRIMATDFLNFTAELDKGDRPRVDYEQISTFPVRLPPSEEQKNIGKKIVTLFSRSSRARDELAHIPKLIERYRQAVLEAAFRGDLTADLRDDREEYRNGELPSGWRLCKLGKLIADGPQNGLYLPKSRYGAGVPILRIENYQNFSNDEVSELKCVKVSDDEFESYKLISGDIVVNRVNSPSHLGKLILIGESLEGALFESNMMRFRLFPDFHPEYICLFLKSPEGKRRLISGAKWAVNQASINQGDVTSTNVPIPPISEAKEIVKRIERLLGGLQALEAEFRSARKLVDRLDASILDKAFSGQLVPQDPNDEPASKLLERIRAARASAPAVKRGRKAKGAADGGLF